MGTLYKQPGQRIIKTGTTDYFLSSAYNPYLASLNPIAWWRLDDPPGSATVKDYSGNGHPGTVNGGVTLGNLAPPTGDTSALFDGSTGYISTSLAGTNFEADVTLMTWVYTTADAPLNSGAISFPGSTPDDAMGLDFDGAGHIKYDQVNDGLISYAAPSNNAWHFVVVTRSGTSVSIYVDGAPDTTGSVSTTPTLTSDAQIARGIVNTYFPGNIAQVAVFDYALTAQQVLELYQLTT